MTVFAATIAMMVPSPFATHIAPPHHHASVPSHNSTNTGNVPRIRHHTPQPMNSAVASWYDLGGTGSCGWSAQSGYGFANLSLPCGTRVKFCYNGNCVIGVMDDHGPYVAGRLFDLNVNLREALNCSDLCEVHWRVMQ